MDFRHISIGQVNMLKIPIKHPRFNKILGQNSLQPLPYPASLIRSGSSTQFSGVPIMTEETSAAKIIRRSRELIQVAKIFRSLQVCRNCWTMTQTMKTHLSSLVWRTSSKKISAIAREYFERLTQVNPSNTQAWVNLGAILNRIRRIQKGHRSTPASDSAKSQMR
jgi:hypothetical protein